MTMISEHNYSLKVKNGAGWRPFNRVRLLISVGKEYHEGNKLLSVVDWINRNPSIGEVHISVNDLLQRHNLIAAGLSEEDASSKSLAAGSLWIARNEEILSGINAKSYFSRWQEWFGTKEYNEAFSALKEYVKQDSMFDDALQDDACTLAVRKEARGEAVPSSLISHSRNYVEEEMAVFALQSLKLPAAEVYPGSNLKSADYFLQDSIKEENLPVSICSLATRHFTRIDFARKKTAIFHGHHDHSLEKLRA